MVENLEIKDEDENLNQNLDQNLDEENKIVRSNDNQMTTIDAKLN